MKDSGENTLVRIDLDRSDNNDDVAIDELVQQRCYFALIEQIKGDLIRFEKSNTNNDLKNDENHPPGSGLVFFIDGTRGAGKSTFLQAAYRELPSKNEKIASLAYIDPSRIEDAELVLLRVLKALANKVDNKIRSTPKLRDESAHQTFRESFKKSAGGLSLFIRDHHQLQHLDPDLFLDYGLERAGHSNDLRKNLHVLFGTACQLLGVTALVLAFDDADTKANHARAVLECIRNYLDTPRLITLVTGDIELYSLIVRDHFFDSLGQTKHEIGEDRRRQRIRMVDHLEDQYLLKLFPIRRRLQLRPLWNLLQSDERVGVKPLNYVLTCGAWADSEHSDRAPEVVIEELLRRGLRLVDASDIRLFREYLLKQPLRSVLQVLSRCAPYLSSGTKDDAEASYLWDDKLSEALRESMRAMALGSLYKFAVDVDAIAAHELPALIDAVFELVNQDGDPDTAAYLRPQPSKEDLKVCFPSLAAEVAGLCARNPAALIQYMLAGPGSVSLFGNVLRRNNGRVSKEILLAQFKQYMGTGRKEDALNWARHATAIIASPHKPSAQRALIDVGIIGLNKDRPKAAAEDSKHVTIARAIKECKTLPVFALSLIDVSGSSNRTYASVFNILGIISRLLQSGNSSKLLLKPYPPLSISCPEWEGGGINLEDDVDDFLKEKNYSEPSAVLLGNLGDLIEGWLEKTKFGLEISTPSSVLLGKIWTRLYFSLEKVSDALRSKKEAGPATLMQMFALCVVNSFLVEEAEHHLVDLAGAQSTINIDRTNPLTSAEVFISQKFVHLVGNHKRLPLTYMIATCPLILGLLEETPETKKLVQELLVPFGEIQGNWSKCLCDSSTWNLIENSFIAGKWKVVQ